MRNDVVVDVCDADRARLGRCRLTRRALGARAARPILQIVAITQAEDRQPSPRAYVPSVATGDGPNLDCIWTAALAATGAQLLM
jgi:hypothetical protein